MSTAISQSPGVPAPSAQAREEPSDSMNYSVPSSELLSIDASHLLCLVHETFPDTPLPVLWQTLLDLKQNLEWTAPSLDHAIVAFAKWRRSVEAAEGSNSPAHGPSGQEKTEDLFNAFYESLHGLTTDLPNHPQPRKPQDSTPNSALRQFRLEQTHELPSPAMHWLNQEVERAKSELCPRFTKCKVRGGWESEDFQLPDIEDRRR